MRCSRRWAFSELKTPAALWAEVERWASPGLRNANLRVGYLLREAPARRGRKASEPSPAKGHGKPDGR